MTRDEFVRRYLAPETYIEAARAHLIADSIFSARAPKPEAIAKFGIGDSVRAIVSIDMCVSAGCVGLIESRCKGYASDAWFVRFQNALPVVIAMRENQIELVSATEPSTLAMSAEAIATFSIGDRVRTTVSSSNFEKGQLGTIKAHYMELNEDVWHIMIDGNEPFVNYVYRHHIELVRKAAQAASDPSLRVQPNPSAVESSPMLYGPVKSAQELGQEDESPKHLISLLSEELARISAELKEAKDAQVRTQEWLDKFMGDLSDANVALLLRTRERDDAVARAEKAETESSTARADERTKIVAWLRSIAPGMYSCYTPSMIANSVDLLVHKTDNK